MKVDNDTEGFENWGTLSVMIMGRHISTSPYNYWKVVPGDFNFTKSPIIEYNLKSSYLTNVNLWK